MPVQALGVNVATHGTAIRRDVPIPYYFQLMQLLQEEIAEGIWRPHEPIPSEHELCNIYRVSRTVVRQALGALAGDGLLYRVKGKGTFVAARKLEEKFIQRSDGFFREMAGRGLDVTTRVLAQQAVEAPPHVRHQLKLPSGTAVINIERLRSVGGQILMYVQTFIPNDLCPDLVSDDLEHGSLYARLREQYSLHIESGKRTVEAVLAHPPISGHLEVRKGAPLLKIESVSYLANGRALEYYEAWHRGDRSKFEIETVPANTPGVGSGRHENRN